MLKKNKGFTTLEVLFVASALSLLTMAFNHTLEKKDKKIDQCEKLEQFLHKHDIHPKNN